MGNTGGTITVYTLESANGSEWSFTTQDPVAAKEQAERYGLKVIANEYEFADSELVWDFTEKADDAATE